MKLAASRLGALLAHGLHESAARVYLALLDHPALPAGTLAKLARVPRSHLYTVLQDLHAMGLAEIRLEGKTRMYRARPFTVFLRQRREELETRIHQIEQEMTGIATALVPPPEDAPASAAPGNLRLVVGRRAVARQIEELLQAASRSATIVSSDGGYRRVARHLDALLPEKPESGGVTIDLHLPRMLAAQGGYERFQRDDVRIRWLRASSPLIAVSADDTSLLLTHAVPDNEDLRVGRDFAMLTRDAEFVRFHLALFREASESAD